MKKNLYDLKTKLVDFAARHCLCVEFEYNTWDDLMEIRFKNPRTHTGRTFCATSEIVADVTYRTMVKTMFDTPGLIDRMEKPEWMDEDEVIDTEPKKIFITTARGSGRSLLLEENQNPYINNGFEIEGFKPDPEFIKRKNVFFNSIFARKGENMNKPTIEKVYFNKPYTIVLWSDKTKTMVRAEGEAYDEEKGLAMAICKKFLGTNKTQGNYFDEFKKWLPEKISKPVVKEVYLSVKEFAKISGKGLTSVRKDCAKGLHPGAKKVDGKWMIPWDEK